MFSDIADYTAIMGRDEARAMAALDDHRALLRTLLPKFNGRMIGEIGDGTLASFHSALDAVNCAREVQAYLEGEDEFRVRIGIHVGDVLFSNNDVHGDGVNVASRIHALAPPGGICISERVYEDIRNKPEMRARDLGHKRLKNVTSPIRVYALAATAAAELPPPERTRWMARALAASVVIVLLAALGFAFMRWRSRTPGSPAPLAAAGRRVIRSIAVLPLDNFSGDPNQEYFSDGLTDELTTDLATISELRVISRGSVMQYKGAHRPPTPQIAKALNVDAVVEGSVVRVGDKVRVTAQLIDAPADKHLWAKNYERDSRDVLAMQDEVAQAIAKEINVELTPNEHKRLTSDHAVDPAAHEAYLRGRYYLSGWSPENLNRAIAQFNRAIKLAPNFALPYAGLADAYSTADDLYTSPSVMPRARAAAEKALQLDDSLAEANAALAGVNFLFDYDFAAAETRYRRAIELGPSYADAHSWYGFLLCMEGRFDEAIAEGKRATDLDPLSSAIVVYASFPYTFQGKYDTATAMLQQGLELEPTSDFAQMEMGAVYLESGNLARAMVELEKARRPDAVPYVEGWLGYAYATSGDRAKAQAMVKELDEASSRRYVSPFSTAMIYLALGDKDRALTGLEKSYQVHSQWLFLLKVDKIFDSLRSEPRFIALLKKVGLDK
jgi:adenylate cyclase